MNSADRLIEFCDSIGCDAVSNEPMSLHTTFKIGGPAEVFLRPKTIEHVKKVILFAKENDTPFYVIGRGSNLLVSDKGVKGAVINLGYLYSEVKVDGTCIECEAGAPLAKLCYEAYKHGLTGLEFAWGIPGSAGGAAYMNAGAYDGEMKDVLVSCLHINSLGEEGVLCGEKLELAYRSSAYQSNNCIITGVKVDLKQGDKKEIKAKMDDLLNRRMTKQPMDMPSAGSTFKRPEGNYASALIEQCGLKGKTVGGAAVSTKHSGFIVNNGGATCEDVLRLIEAVQAEVYKQTGYTLECEVKRI